jgi:hypothetical protein
LWAMLNPPVVVVLDPLERSVILVFIVPIVVLC